MAWSEAPSLKLNATGRLMINEFLSCVHFQQDFAALQREVKALRQSFDYDIKVKNEREGSATKKLGELQYGVDSRLEAETAIRHEQINIIKREIERLIK